MKHPTLQAKAELERRRRIRVWCRWHQAVWKSRACLAVIQAVSKQHGEGSRFEQESIEVADEVQPDSWKTNGGWDALKTWADRLCDEAEYIAVNRRWTEKQPHELQTPPFVPAASEVQKLKSTAHADTPRGFAAAAMASMASVARHHSDFVRRQKV